MKTKLIIVALCVVMSMLFSTVACFATGETVNVTLSADEEATEADGEPIMTILSAPNETIAEDTLGVPVISPAPAPVSREAVIKALWEMAGEPVVNYIMPFSDVDQESECAEAIRWAASEQIVLGCGDAKFNGADVATREQIATMIYRYEQKENNGGFTGAWMFLLDAEDRAEISSWANEAVHWLYMNSLLTSTEGKLSPKGVMTPAMLEELLTAYKALNAPEITVVGGWTEKNEEITEEVQAVFDKAMEGFTGVGYKAKKLLGTQVVAGTNYKFLCDATGVYPGAVTTQKVVTIYVDLEGNASVTDVAEYTAE